MTQREDFFIVKVYRLQLEEKGQKDCAYSADCIGSTFNRFAVIASSQVFFYKAVQYDE